MLRTISGTFASRFVLALLNFATIILTARALGAEGRGEISYFVANMVLVSLFTALIGGPSLVYLTPRHNFFKFLMPSYLWGVLLAFLFCEVFFYTRQLTTGDYYFLLLAIVFNSWKATNQMILLGKEHVKVFNWLALLHSVLLIVIFLWIGYGTGEIRAESFYWSIVLSNFVVWLWSTLVLLKEKEHFQLLPGFSLLKKMAVFGGLAQLANMIQFANYRISYFYLMNMQEKSGAEELGKYSVAVSIAESVWIIGQSLATVQVSKLSNIKEGEVQKKISLRMFRFNFILNLAAVLLLLLVPAAAYVYIFGSEEFGQVAVYIRWLSIGIFMLGISTSLSAYFGGKGNYWPAVGSATAGALVTWSVCHFFISDWGATAASAAASLSYTVVSVYFIVCFLKTGSLNIREMIPGVSEILVYKRWLKAKLRKWQSQ